MDTSLKLQRLVLIMKIIKITIYYYLVYLTAACQVANDCHQHGDCVNGVCQCQASWTGESCQTPNCVGGTIDKQGTCHCDFGSSLREGICTKDCKHGVFQNTTGKCQCNDNWSTAGITDTIDWLKGSCSQFKCQTSNQCQSLLPSVSNPSCPVKGWNCYCGFSHLGFQNNQAGCMSFPYAFSVAVFKVYKYLCLSLFWKIGLSLAIISLPFGRRRPNCDHHRSWMAKIKNCLGCPTTCDGSCIYQKRWCLRDDFALSLYFVKTTCWWYMLASCLIAILGYIWSMILWIIISVVLIVAACAACLALCNGNDSNSNNDCDNCERCLCCSDCNGTGCCSQSYTSHGNTYNTNIVYIGGPYPDPCWGCYCCEPTPYYGSTERTSSYPRSNSIDRNMNSSSNDNDDCGNGKCGCCCCCFTPLKYLVSIYPVFPENLHGGFVGYLMGTHIKKNNYTGGNRFIDWMSLSQFRTRDLRHNQEWRQTIRGHLIHNYNETTININDDDHVPQPLYENYGDILSKPLIPASAPPLKHDYRTVYKYGLYLNNYALPITEEISIVNRDHINANECWICCEPAVKWHVWKSCRHAYCESCSEKMLSQKMPCPLCRNAPIGVDVYPTLI